MKNFETYAVFIIAGTLLVIVLGIALVLGQTSRNSETTLLSPTPFLSTLPYEKDAGDRLAQKLVKRQPLSAADATAKEVIISKEKDGSVYNSANVIVSYNPDLGIFQSEILTQNIQLAKTETRNWFLSQGMSEGAICNIPVIFSLNPEVETKLPEKERSFNPLAPGC